MEESIISKCLTRCASAGQQLFMEDDGVEASESPSNSSRGKSAEAKSVETSLQEGNSTKGLLWHMTTDRPLPFLAALKAFRNRVSVHARLEIHLLFMCSQMCAFMYKSRNAGSLIKPILRRPSTTKIVHAIWDSLLGMERKTCDHQGVAQDFKNSQSSL